jgi:hypothetical protein
MILGFFFNGKICGLGPRRVVRAARSASRSTWWRCGHSRSGVLLAHCAPGATGLQSSLAEAR